MQSVALVLRPDFQVMCLAAISAFEFANLVAGKKLYDIRVYSEHGGLVASSLHTAIDTTPLAGADFDTVLVTGALGGAAASAGIHHYLQQAAADARRIGALCVGAFALAEARLLDGKHATVHWSRAPEMRRNFPLIKVEEDRIYVVDGKIWTSAGMSAAVDLTLAMVDEDFGPELARSVAQEMVVYHRRAGGQSQRSVLAELHPTSGRISQALDYARRNLQRELTVNELADAAFLSPRQFSRTFRSEIGITPAKAIEKLRLEAARFMLEQGRQSIELVAAETGFGDRDRMRRAFLRVYGQTPQSLRRASDA